MRRSSLRLWVSVFCVALLIAPLGAQSGSQQQVPDAPSAVQPPKPAPPSPPPQQQQPNKPAPQPQNPANQPSITPRNTGQVHPQQNGRDQMAYKISTTVNYVIVPVLVKDINGALVQGLTERDFRIFENGTEQKVDSFSADPFPISAVVVVDTAMPGSVLDKVKNTLPAVFGAFSDFDEVSVFTFDHTVRQEHTFSSVAGNQMDTTVQKIRSERGSEGGVTFAGGPFNDVPRINGQPVVPGSGSPTPTTSVARTNARVLNDAILEAAQALIPRDRSRRRIIFVISEGQEKGSKTSFNDVRKVLQSHNIAVYALGVGAAAAPIYGKAENINLPGLNRGNVLRKYVDATGGEAYTEYSQSNIERAYSRITEEARNQYTLGYAMRNPLDMNYRSIDVRVDRPDCSKVKSDGCVYTYATDGYFPVPSK